ncbi:cupin domain-containing protein [Legionella israelensis]|uniref:Cupin domain-containing protein n=1 Tax=Legionella israelensis TaxID=454 RepID=A0AAX1EIE5_9GAMM|nr:cupin domain-containing protein [Legionella israelensis]QBR84597.1 cupin domain-containing protein [Legionella israelensis]
MRILNYFEVLKEKEQFPQGKTNINIFKLFEQLPEAAFACGYLSPAGKQRKHWHKTGMDIFIIKEGEGILHTADVDKMSETASNFENHSVKAGDIYYIGTYQVHALENSGDIPLIWLNIAPISHGQSDIFFI